MGDLATGMTELDESVRYVPTRGCPICGTADAVALQRMRFALPDGHPLSDHYTVACCASCGFVYADTPSSQRDYDRYYGELSKYSDGSTGTGGGEEDWDRRRLEDTARTIAAAVVNPLARIMDIGCANGGLLAALGREGMTRLEGVDPSPPCVATTSRIPNVTAYVGGLFNLPHEARDADCAILSHVLEHVRDVPRALAQLRSTVREGGLVYVEVPDATRYADCLVAPFQDFNVEHINHFSPESLTNALERSGFVVTELGQKTISASATAPYPALFAIAMSSRGLARDPRSLGRDTSRDTVLAPAIRRYIDKSHTLLGTIARHLDEQLAGTPDIVIWGTGQTTLTAFANTTLGGARVVAFTDSSPRYHGRRLAGIPVVAPESLGVYDAPIVIGSIIHHDAIAKRIRELGLPNAIVSLAPQATTPSSNA